MQDELLQPLTSGFKLWRRMPEGNVGPKRLEFLVSYGAIGFRVWGIVAALTASAAVVAVVVLSPPRSVSY